MAGYTHKGVELDTLFEALLPGDPTHPELVGAVTADGKDASQLYVALAGGARVPENVGYQHKTTDFRDIFAAKGTVSRFLKPLPWDRTIDHNLTLYRQKSRPLVTTMKLSVAVTMDGHVEIKATKPNRHSDPASMAESTIYALTAPPAWNDQFTPAGVDFEVRFDVVSNNGSLPSSTILFGTWVLMDGTPNGASFENVLNYYHNTMVEGNVSKNTNIRISVRRSDLPDNIKTDAITVMNINMTVLADLFASNAPWTANLSALVSNNMPRFPEGKTGDYSVVTSYQVKGLGNLVVKRRITDFTGTSGWTELINVPWRRALTADDTAPNDFEVRFNPGTGVTFNGAPNWTTIEEAGSYELTMTHSVPNDYAVGDYPQSSSGTLAIRQKSTVGYVTADNFISGGLAATTTIRIGPPIAPDWTGMTLPDIIIHRNVEIDYSKPARWETAGTRYIMGLSTNPTANNVVGKEYRQTTDNIANPSEPVIEVDKVLTRITPTGWNPSWFEWRYRVLSGATDNNTPGVWRNMSNASHIVQVSCSINHGSGVGDHVRFADIAIDVRRISTPSQTYTFTCRLEAGVHLFSNGPNWTGMTLGNMSTVQSAVAGTLGSWQASIGAYMGASTDTTGNVKHVNTYVWNFANNSSEGVVLTPWKRLVPAGFSPNDFEWKWELVSQSGTGDVSGGPAAGTWMDVSENEWIAATTLADKVTGTHMQTQTYAATVRVTVRHKVQVGWIYTFPDFTMTASIQWQNPPYFIWPRADYQNWAGTYYHTSSHEGGGSQVTGWQDPFEGVTVNTAAVWTFTFNSNGDWLWEGNGLVQYEQNGQWLSAIQAGAGSNYSIRVINLTGMVATSANITSTWQKMNVARYISITAAKPPAGEPDNNRIYKATIEIRNDSTGQIYQTGPINLTSTSENR